MESISRVDGMKHFTADEPKPATKESRTAALAYHQPTSAYLHIPFCRRRCYYCDFPISVVGDRPPLARQGVSSFGTIAEYVEVLCQEIRTVAASGQPLQTVFLGGGTPSLLTVSQLGHILEVLDQQFGIATDAEISIEMDPGTFDWMKIYGYRAAGVNRVSLGVQAFQADLLAACGRTHTPTDIDQAVALLNRAGIRNFSLDLISGLPHLTLDRWQESLAAAIALAPTHLSIYDLTIEPGTAFQRWYRPGVAPLPTEESTAEMYRMAQRTLTAAGYQHYEISNYAKPGYQCRHNCVYWRNRPYYGFGLGATSYVQGQRFSRPRTRRDYYQWVQIQQQTGGQIDGPLTSETDRLLETLMLGLRLAEGLAISELVQEFGEAALRQILECLYPYGQQGWVEVVAAGQSSSTACNAGLASPQQGYIRLRDPEGFLFSNVILTALFEQFSEM